MTYNIIVIIWIYLDKLYPLFGESWGGMAGRHLLPLIVLYYFICNSSKMDQKKENTTTFTLKRVSGDFIF